MLRWEGIHTFALDIKTDLKLHHKATDKKMQDNRHFSRHHLALE